MDSSSPTRDLVEPTARSDGDALTLADVLVGLDAVAGITQSRRRDLISAVRRIANLLNRDPSALPADPARLRPLLEGVCAARARVSARTWANLRSCLAAALRITAGKPRSSGAAPLSSAWSGLLAALPDRHASFGLSRFARFCSAAGIAPSEVDEGSMERFGTHLRTETLCPRPNELLRRAAMLWNRAAEQVPGWPARQLLPPSFRKPRGSLRLEDLAESFRRDAEDYLARLAGTDLFAVHVPPHVCKPRTLKLRRTQIELMASALVNRGIPVASLRTLADLVEVEHEIGRAS